ncbi:MAG: hypothetical protein M5U26_30815 [Planctomycetota bacterium]|nr:hypothetical protein [Planctomycetota bacterium]
MPKGQSGESLTQRHFVSLTYDDALLDSATKLLDIGDNAAIQAAMSAPGGPDWERLRAMRARICPDIPQWLWEEMLTDLPIRIAMADVEVSLEVATETEELRHRAMTFGLLVQVQCARSVYLRSEPEIGPTEAEQLSPRQWEVVALVCNRGLDLPEAAERLGIEPGTARKHFDAAAKSLGLSVKELRRRRLGGR